MTAEPCRIPALLARTTRALAEAGVDQAGADAVLLVAKALAVEPDQWWQLDLASPAHQADLAELVARRIAGTPAQHLVGSVWFAGRRYRVGPGVFIPRPETELLAQWAVTRLQAVPDPVPKAVDLGTGSGIIAGTLAAAVPRARVVAIELSPTAAAMAEQNLAGLGVQVQLADLAQALPECGRQLDLVVSNPPYVPAVLRGQLPSVVDQDPELALYSGPDGLDAPLQVIATASRLLKPGGWVGMEHAEEHPPVLQQRLAAAGFDQVVTHPDLAGRPRFTVGRLAAPLD